MKLANPWTGEVGLLMEKWKRALLESNKEDVDNKGKGHRKDKRGAGMSGCPWKLKKALPEVALAGRDRQKGVCMSGGAGREEGAGWDAAWWWGAGSMSSHSLECKRLVHLLHRERDLPNMGAEPNF